MLAIHKLKHQFFCIVRLKNNDEDEDFALTVGLSLSSPCLFRDMTSSEMEG